MQNIGLLGAGISPPGCLDSSNDEGSRPLSLTVMTRETSWPTC